MLLALLGACNSSKDKDSRTEEVPPTRVAAPAITMATGTIKYEARFELWHETSEGKEQRLAETTRMIHDWLGNCVCADSCQSALLSDVST